MGEAFRGMREYAKENKARRRTQNLKYIMQVKDFSRRELTIYQHRFGHESIGEFIDIYPTHARYHNLITGERGHYKTIQSFLQLQLDRTSQFKLESLNGAENE